MTLDGSIKSNSQLTFLSSTVEKQKRPGQVSFISYYIWMIFKIAINIITDSSFRGFSGVYLLSIPKFSTVVSKYD